MCFRWLSPFAWLCAFVGSCLFCGLSVSPPLHWGSRLCCLWCVWLSPPSPRLFPGGVLAQSSFCCIGPSLWVSGCFLRRPGCLICCLECCGALLPRFMLLHGSKGLWPCVGNWFTLYTLGHVLLWALRSFTEVFIFMMIQVPPEHR